MPNIKYYNGNEVVEVEVSEKQLDAIKDIARTEDRHRKQIKRHGYHKPFDFDAVLSNDLTPEEELMEQQDLSEKARLLKILATAITKLNIEQQQIIDLKFYQNKNDTEISRELGLSRQAVQSRIETILKKLLKKF